MSFLVHPMQQPAYGIIHLSSLSIGINIMDKDVFDNTFLRMAFVILFWFTAMPSFAYAQATPSKPALIIDDIICQGNENTECDFVTKKYYQQIGQVLDADEIADARLRLGTLIQFKSVNIHLEKGSQRNHVVVVFDVNEASNIQYELGANYGYSESNGFHSTCLYNVSNDDELNLGVCDSNSSADSVGLSAKITDFNFLGTGKELSLLFNNRISQSTGDRSLNTPENLPPINEWNSNNQSHSFTVDYYDPYFLGSPYYYLNVNTDFGYSKRDYEHKLLSGDYSLSSYSSFKSDDSKFSLYSLNTSLGRRFARHSYVALNVQKRLDDFKDSVNIVYGWNSEDDILFPTTGSAFTINNNLDLDNNQTSLSYKQHFNLTNNKVLTLSSWAALGLYKSTLTSSNLWLSARYSSHLVLDKLNGSYSGWYIETGIGGNTFKYSDYDTFSASISAGYTHQTESMIYRLSLNLNIAESE